jgi:hypothetical protein
MLAAALQAMEDERSLGRKELATDTFRRSPVPDRPTGGR